MAGTQETHAATSLSTMPTEIISGVYSNLNKQDLKSVRLTCHRLDEITQPVLFDKVIVTSMNDNAGLFECVINKPNLARHIKTLVFDVLRFWDLSAAYYVQHLMQQMERDVARHPKWLVPPGPLRKKLEKANWFKDPVRTHRREKVLALFIQDLAKDYETYNIRQNEQKECIDTSLPQCGAIAFAKCGNIQRMEVQTEWQAYDQQIDNTLMSLLPRFLSSGNVARHYNPVLLRPTLPTRRNQEQFLLQLLESASQVTKLKVGKGFIGPRGGLETFRTLFFQHLTNLDLWTSNADPPPFSVDYLALALQTAHSLQHLHIEASNTTVHEHIGTHRHRLFPLLQGCVWPQLVSLKLSGMAASAEEFLTLFGSNKGLQSLCLNSIDLRVYPDFSNGDRKGFSESGKAMPKLFRGMRRLMSLTEFSIEPPFRAQIDSYKWATVRQEDFPEFKRKWEQVVLEPVPLDAIPVRSMYDFEES
ncbi:MAG: hypothetical protein Q9221_006369 [Calogaya cf. arnoldii]